MTEPTLNSIPNTINEPPIAKRPKGCGIALALAIISIVIAILILALSFMAWRQLHIKLSSIDSFSQQLQQNMQQNEQQTQLLFSLQQKTLNNNEKVIEHLMKLNSRQDDQLTIREIEYLVRLSIYNLTFVNDTTTAKTLLEMANERAQSLNNPALMNLRQVLANDIATLNAVPKIDIAGLMIRINALISQIPELPLIPTHLNINNQPKSVPENTQNQPLWKRFSNHVTQSLKEMVVIRHHEQPVEPLLSPTQQAYLVQSIQSQLSQAQWAILHQNSQIYQHSLRQASDWIRRYFIQNQASTVSMLSALADLQAVPIKPPVPDLSNALKAAEDALMNTSTASPMKTVDKAIHAKPAQESVAS